MDRLEQLAAARQLAAETVAAKGTDGMAQAVFIEEAVARFPLLSSSERIKVWREAAGLPEHKPLPKS